MAKQSKSIQKIAGQIKTAVANLNKLVEEAQSRNVQLELNCTENELSIVELTHKVEQDFLSEPDTGEDDKVEDEVEGDEVSGD